MHRAHSESAPASDLMSADLPCMSCAIQLTLLQSSAWRIAHPAVTLMHAGHWGTLTKGTLTANSETTARLCTTPVKPVMHEVV